MSEILSIWEVIFLMTYLVITYFTKFFMPIIVVNKGFIHVVNDHIHEPNNLLNRNE